MPEARVLCVIFIFIACVLIALGRLLVRRARRARGSRIGRRTLGWGLVVFGCIFMIVGVALW